MSRVVLLGIAGGGKSTLARRISASLGLPLHQMDKLGWLPGWILAGNDHVNPLHDQIMATDRWVIDGYGSWQSIEQRCDAADTLILMDQPAWRHYWYRTAKHGRAVALGDVLKPTDADASRFRRVKLRLLGVRQDELGCSEMARPSGGT